MSVADDLAALRKAIKEFFLVVCSELRIDAAVRWLSSILAQEQEDE